MRPSAARTQLPPHTYFLVSAVFHYLGPAFAVLLFARVDPLGVAWLRIVGAAAVFAIWRAPWRAFVGLSPAGRRTLVLLGITLAAMNVCFYLAIARLPLATVGAMEFLGPVALAAAGARNRRNLAALLLVVAGVAALTDVRLEAEPIGLAFSFANCALFTCYIVLGHRVAQDGAAEGVDRLGTAMLVASVAVAPVGLADAAPAFVHPALLGAGLGVAVCSSVIPYVCDQLAMARLPRATFALLMALLPATATVIGAVVLRQIPSPAEIAGIGLVAAAIAVHRDQRRK
ncbi:MAG: EamA family transporter [Streptosporangiales bacterium]|nr:EamA family transporter [Streptosporangiales bacterium]